jgi:sulfatase modifying factor 1
MTPFPLPSVYDCEDGFVYTAPVAHFAPDGFGVYDMTGNVAEWCRDKYGSYLNNRTIIHGMPINFHQKSPIIDPQGAKSGSSHMIRGGTWISPPQKSRTASREKKKSDFRHNTIGFRIVEKI